ncbi:hypothetical protein N806_15615 [Rhodococcus sp. P27]|nr:hypothetical protein N806_15615 [Rhodococcus sp. P27]
MSTGTNESPEQEEIAVLLSEQSAQSGLKFAYPSNIGAFSL